VRVETDVDALTAWCHANGFPRVNSQAVQLFVAWKAQEILRAELKT
jgi:hypothetical protein